MKPPRKPGRSGGKPVSPRGKPARPRGAAPSAKRIAEQWGVRDDDAPAKAAKPARAPKQGTARPDRRLDAAQPSSERKPPHPKPKTQSRARPAPGRPVSDKPASSRPAADRPTGPKSPPQATAPARSEQRIAKLLARAGIASRREIERMIAEGRVALNGELLTTPATLLTSLKGVTVDGAPVAETEATRLFLFHKPSGCITAERDPAGRPTIYDRLPKGDLPRLMPVGRLDMTTEGLLLLTNDGELKRTLELPVNGIERTYRARAFGEISQTQLEQLIEGVEIDGMRYGRIDANLERRTGRNQWIEMTLTEGKNREVRRVLEHLGLQVNRLIRTRYGPFDLAGSEPGALVEIRRGDLDRFLGALKRLGK
ncbi:MAG: pseudouridine synthase [Sphingobium sp.]